ncbi:hypothetical protein ED733_000176 [Metarhizium rileyi]|uniref:Uncharacterized protein n=1 Tax=Metarhizium rileyi (strain RCEF 4871) TaxID=1649241 RepID=A0A5C6G3M5_METRR|nr:hypothetical protein ED733_000176 [Metarhizium rileyi]
MNCDRMEGPTHPTDTDPNDVTWLFDRVSNHERSPKGLADAWPLAQTSDPNTTTRCFVDEGKYAWVAYHVSKTASEQGAHFPGQNLLRNQIADLEKQSLDSRRSIAEKLETGLPPIVKAKIDRWWAQFNRQRSNKRRRLNERDSHQEAVAGSRHRASSTSSTNSSLTPIQESQQLVHSPFAQLDYTAQYEQVFVNASLEETIRLFKSSSLSDAVRRILEPGSASTLVASISMSFPNVRSDFGCQMAIEIMENKIDNIARDLFNVRLEVTAGLRYICLPDGGKILPNPKFTIRGCPIDTITRNFGKEVGDAVRANPAFQDELNSWRQRTDCIWMVISHKANDKAQVCLSMGLIQGTLIQRRLYK